MFASLNDGKNAKFTLVSDISAVCWVLDDLVSKKLWDHGNYGKGTLSRSFPDPVHANRQRQRRSGGVRKDKTSTMTIATDTIIKSNVFFLFC